MKKYIAFILMYIFAHIDKLLASNKEKKRFEECADYVNEHIEEECRKLRIRKPFVIIGLINRPKTKGECVGGFYIRIDPLKDKGDDYLSTLRHELRHMQQWKYRRDAMMWLHVNLDKEKDKNEYWYNPAEIDARLYSRGYESNIMDIPVDSFAEMKKNGTFIDQMKAVALFFGDVYAEIDCY